MKSQKDITLADDLDVRDRCAFFPACLLNFSKLLQCFMLLLLVGCWLRHPPRRPPHCASRRAAHPAACGDAPLPGSLAAGCTLGALRSRGTACKPAPPALPPRPPCSTDIYRNFLLYCMTGDVVQGPMGVTMVTGEATPLCLFLPVVLLAVVSGVHVGALSFSCPVCLLFCWTPFSRHAADPLFERGASS
jgi:hypothetical protein